MNAIKVINGVNCCANNCACNECPYNNGSTDCDDCIDDLLKDALKMMKEQKEIIDNYHKADTFLAVHGWQWKETTTESSTNPKEGEK